VTGNVLNKLGQLCAWSKKKNSSTKLLGSQISVSLWKNTRFSNFEATLPWNFNHKFTEEKKCANYFSFGHFHCHPVIVWCHHRHGLLQALKPCFWLKIYDNIIILDETSKSWAIGSNWCWWIGENKWGFRS
jgi:hypothetical protein